MFEKTHFKVFQSTISDCLSQPEWSGYPTSSLAAHMESKKIGESTAFKATNDRLTRADLFHKAADRSVSDVEIYFDIMAWGGANRNHALKLIEAEYLSFTLELISLLRHDEISSNDCYARFSELRKYGYLPGIGPAFFTKIIFFCSPNHDGFIMDQWTGKSMNLLLGNELVLLKNGYVSDNNDVRSYSDFCDRIREIAVILKGAFSAAQIEQALFSRGGGKKALPWRKYVIERYT
jgi:hypothetical protein